MKKVAYDKHYRKEHYFGNAYPEMIDFFKTFDKHIKILDLGCGQGRDALTLAELGYEVIGVDHSSVGIQQMLEEADRKNLILEGQVADIYTYEIPKDIGMVLLDSMFHFYPKDLKKETEFLQKILSDLKIGGYFCNFIIAGKKGESHLKRVIAESPYTWEVIHEGYARYVDFNADYHMLILKKLS